MYDILEYNARKIQIFTKKCAFYLTPQPQRHKNHAVETFHTQYTAYQKHPCHRCGAPTNPPPIQDSSL